MAVAAAHEARRCTARHARASAWPPRHAHAACAGLGERSGTLTCLMSAFQAYVWLSCGILGHLNFQYVNVMTNDIGIAHDDLIAKRATGAHGPTGMGPEQQVQEQRIVSGGRRRLRCWRSSVRTRDATYRTCSWRARRAPSHAHVCERAQSAHYARLPRFPMLAPGPARVPRSQASCSQCARDVVMSMVMSAKVRAVPCSVTRSDRYIKRLDACELIKKSRS